MVSSPTKRLTLAEAFEKPDEELVVCGANQTILNKKRFLLNYAQNGNITRSAELTGISRRTVDCEWYNDPDFQEEFKRASLTFMDRLALVADHRAVEGIDKPIVWRGDVTGHYKEYSDNLLMFRMKKLDPSYRDGPQVNINNNNIEVRTIEVRLAGVAPTEQLANGSPALAQKPETAIIEGEAREITP